MSRPSQKIVRGLPKGSEAQAAALYWQAFGAKLGKLLGPEQRGIGFFTATVNHQAVIAALDADGGLTGIAAFKIGENGFSRAGFGDLFRHYGLGALWRIWPLVLLERRAPADTLQMDGISVSATVRGQGVGTALFDALFAYARDLGLQKVTLDVIDSNPRARALYERLGFVAVGAHSTSFLRPLLGFKSATKMVLTL